MMTDDKQITARQAEKDLNVAMRIRRLKGRDLSAEQLLAEAAEWYVAAMDLYVEVKEAQHLAEDGLQKFITTSNALGFALGRIERLSAEPTERAKKANLASRKSGNHVAMTSVFGYWQRWQDAPNLYEGRAAFVRDMREKHPTLENDDSIKNATRRWERIPHEVRDGVVVKKEQIS